MTAATHLVRTYMEVFGSFEDEDQDRISLLLNAIDNKINLTGKTQTLEQALESAQNYKQSAALRGLIALRSYYLKPSAEAKYEALDYLTETGTTLLTDSITDCLEVLRRNRINELKHAFDKAYDVKDPITRSKAIHAAAETLHATGITFLQNYALTHIAEYHATLKRELEEVAGDNYATCRDFYAAAAPLLASQVPDLVNFVKKLDVQTRTISKVSNASQQESHAA